MGHEVLVEVVRSGLLEGTHHGSVVALAADGSVEWSKGDPDAVVLPRSCNKPLQAAAMVRLGLMLEPRLLALASASHSGEPFQVAAVREILALAGLDETALHNPADWPLDSHFERELIAAGGEQTRLQMNCSGKHAAMLLTCQVNGWPIDDYLDPGHPLQQAIATTFAELTGQPVGHEAIDGCGAPLLGTSLVGLATAFSRLATAAEGTAEHAVATAIRDFPEYVSGTRRDEYLVLRAIPGAIAKAGAEACHVLALADGSAFALKIADGGIRARPVVLAAALERSGVLAGAGVDAAAVRATGEKLLTGGGVVVGAVRAVL
ncbi:asparaginase [Nocardioides sp. Bht2]|uniref:asparaginase n=1 Tax=Nocardioides sp. Bht2 TaxID=3392297 RepID=UPI0039B3E634